MQILGFRTLADPEGLNCTSALVSVPECTQQAMEEYTIVLSHLKSSLQILKWALSITLSSYHPPLISWLSSSPETISYPVLSQCQLFLSSAADDPASNLAENTGLIRWRFPHLLSTKSTNLPPLVPALSDSPPERKGSQLLFGWAKQFICGSHLILLSLLPCTSPLLLKSPPLSSVSSASSSLVVAVVCKYAALFPK